MFEIHVNLATTADHRQRARLPDTAAALGGCQFAVEPRDLLLEEDVTWGLGVMVGDGYGMAGLDGSLGWADPAPGLAEAYIARQLRTHERAEAMNFAVRAALN